MGTASLNLTAEERKERKKLQNRANQRARRQRLRDEEDPDPKARHPYRVSRWRLNDDPSPSTRNPQTGSGACTSMSRQPTFHDHTDQEPQSRDASARSEEPLALEVTHVNDARVPLPVDHLLIHLITDNVCRGLLANKSTLRDMASFISGITDPPLPAETSTTCEITVVRPTQRIMPPTLQPTLLQMNLPHPAWIDIFPYPEMRDNLIRRQHFFDHVSFLADLVGEFALFRPSGRGSALEKLPSSEWDDDNPSGNGFVLWGEPHLKESWEATPRFLAKWAWAVEGCDEIIRIANGWRSTRGERPLQPSIARKGLEEVV
ncbi:hypothetical protein NM208_g2529 [Fusarium decemcellulare]|uniref:Uncharacterized protein n=1 Tax=Fusarium decemcellulare TaxID=57161 RepID=A0ACC1SSH9_9HYPO|nr:hypothetical protein NM208_g2529 [Fusarium decemcellulare]